MNPVLIGAGIGALGSAVQGKSPLTGALLGGVTGGVFGGSESLLGGKIASAFGEGATGGIANGITATEGAIPSVGIQGFGQGAQLLDKLPVADAVESVGNLSNSWNIGQGAKAASGAFEGGIPLSTGNLSGGLADSTPLSAINTSKLFNYTPPTMLEKIQGAGTDAYSWIKDNPTTAGGYALKGVEAATARPPISPSGQTQIRQGQFQGYTPALEVSNVAPKVNPIPINKTGMMQVDTVVAQHPELRKLYPDLFGG